MLKRFKQVTLNSLKTAGVSRLVQKSSWRRQRLLILAYHGISLDDEHLWNGSQYISPEIFRNRLQSLKKLGCNVLPLNEAISRLYANDLPPKSVAITFDDGTYDFCRQAFPALQEFGFPSTLYLTTFYSHYNKPVFDLMCSYLLWKGRGETLDLKEITGRDWKADLRDPGSQAAAMKEIHKYARERKLSADDKDALATSVARHLKVNYDDLLERRVMHNLRPDEVMKLAAEGVDIQLHTHRHRTPMDRKLFLREIEDNRNSIQGMTGRVASHFCYPTGKHDQAFLPWLREAGVVSATTCEAGFAHRSFDPLLLPRFLDSNMLSPIEFESWLTGISAALPRRR
jgi:peptidoglycan/xylan/chitin deacetylase (PgdA/CDA1 family)